MLKTVFLAICAAVVAFQVKNTFFRKPTSLSPNQLNLTYDYVVVGAGSAGCVLAARLSENGKNSVLLLEAGSHEYVPFYSHIPAGAPYMARTNVDWGYFTEPQTHGLNSVVDRQSYWPRGKGLGGSSVLNWMVYVRGHPDDYDHWAELGNQGWSYAEVLPYFNKAETVEVEKHRKSKNRGHAGPVHVSEARTTEPGKNLLKGARELGMHEISESNGLEMGGLDKFQFTAHNGIRQSTVKTYLRPVEGRTNLHIMTDAHVTKIVLDTTSRDQVVTAQGVEYLHSGQIHTVLASREVILSAGTVNSPQILMLSGIGPADHLQDHQIPVLVESPNVGQHLDDHFGVHVYYSLNETDATEYENPFSVGNLAKSIPQYLMFGTGALTTPPMELVGFFKTGLPVRHKGPDVELMVFPGRSAPDPVIYMNYGKDAVDSLLPTPENRSTITLLAMLLHPHNTGEIRLKSRNPLDHPSIDPKYFHNDVDDKVLGAGLKMLIDLMGTKAMSKYDPKLLEKPLPGCDGEEFLSDNYLACIAKRRAFTIYHPIGTCKMGREIGDSVVDDDLRVHGVKGLRVVDASVMPGHMSGHTNAPTIMVAEKAADLILSGK